MKIIGRFLLPMLVFFVSGHAVASDLAGVWGSDELPALVEITFADGVGTGTVLRNDKNPEAVGRVLLKGIKGEADAGPWQAKIYAERFKEYKDATISLLASGDMEIVVKVGFMSKTVLWHRAQK